MTLYSAGTLGLVNGSTGVTGTGTAWVGVLRPGWLLMIPGKPPVLVQSVQAAGSLTLARPYQGTTRTGVAYDAVATRGELAAFLSQLQTVLMSMQATIDGPGAGKFADGTAATPGLRFAADEDSGLRRKAPNRLALVTGGADRLEIDNSGATLTGLLTGTAVMQSQTDATPGRLMKTGSFGFGGLLPLLLDFSVVDQSIIPGFTPMTWRSAVRAAQPVSIADRSSTCDAPRPGARPSCSWSRAPPPPRLWPAWHIPARAATALGRPGSAAGWPAAAAMPAGGTCGLPDGTQTCTGLVTLACSGVAGILTAIWTYPAAFSAPPVTSFISRTSGGDYTNVGLRGMGARVVYPGTLTAVLNQYSAPGASGTWDGTSQIANVSVIATGRWY
jgi:hypothetical protein